jgi:hypothetical protein
MATCYFPIGNVADGHTPCNASAEQSWCCASGNYCLSNGHCLQVTDNFSNRIGRGSCTDRTWRSPECPFECADGQLSSPPLRVPNGGSRVWLTAHAVQFAQTKTSPSSSRTRIKTARTRSVATGLMTTRQEPAQNRRRAPISLSSCRLVVLCTIGRTVQ